MRAATQGKFVLQWAYDQLD